MSTTPKNELAKTQIYVMKDPDTLEIRYVGKTVKENIVTRLGEHIQEAKRGRKNHRLNWIRSILDKGKIPIIEKIDECIWKESQGLETYYITYYKNLGYDLVNETEGGEGNLGYTPSKETVEKRKKSIRSKLPKVYQYDLKGNFIKEWNNAPEAAEKLGFKADGITRCLRGDRFKYKEFIWKTELIDNAAEDLIKNQELRHIRNVTKSSKGHTHCLLGKLISQECKLCDTPYIYVYSKNDFTRENLLYEAISQNDAGCYINSILDRPDIDINSRITSCIKNNIPYYDKFYISTNTPKDYVNIKHKCLLIINDGLNIYYGVNDAEKQLGVNKANIINNLKGTTKNLTVNNKKIKLKWTLNKEHCRLYVKTYGLSMDELEERAKEELNIELTD